jgi:hypothetical protein
MAKSPLFVLGLGLVFVGGVPPRAADRAAELRLNDREYLAMPGLDVLAFQDVYPEGHQGGVEIIQNGVRVATNGDVRLEPAPGQWAPVPVQKERTFDRKRGEIVTALAYPDPDKDRRGFNPIEYPDLKFSYKVRVRAEGSGFRILVDLDQPLPPKWAGKVGFNLELFPGALFGRAFYLDQASGVFPRQPSGPVRADGGDVQPVPLATGRRLTVAPESDEQRMMIESFKAPLELVDGRTNHPNGWFIVRAVFPAGATTGAVDWLVQPHAIPGWKRKPVVHVSQVGYHPAQPKVAVIEVDAADAAVGRATLIRLGEDGKHETILQLTPKVFGPFLRYRYLTADFTDVRLEGMYVIEYGKTRTEPFRIARDVWKRNVWQPTLEYFLPVQMCHMRVAEKYRVWHGLCHMDDALMAPVDHLHHDGYQQGSSTLTKWKPQQPVPGLNVGGWHDAGDDDLRVESQAGEVYVLSLIQESFGPRHDATAIDQHRHTVEIRQPDGKPDLLQQIEHGALQVVGSYKALGRLPRGTISPTLRQYTMVGDVANQTDGLTYDPRMWVEDRSGNRSGRPDDRWVFTEKNPGRALAAAAGLAAGARALRGYNDALAADCLHAAEAIWHGESSPEGDAITDKIQAAVELLLATKKDEYRTFLINSEAEIGKRVAALGWVLGRALPVVGDAHLTAAVHDAVAAHDKEVEAARRKSPFGVPYEPVIWGAGWGIQKFGVEQYFLHAAFPDIVGPDRVWAALDFVLGCHPGDNTASFASGIGARSMTVAYGWNRADWSYIPGGVVSGTNLIRPDFPELKDFPFLWQQAEYVIGGGASHFMFLVLAADQLLEGKPPAPKSQPQAAAQR